MRVRNPLKFAEVVLGEWLGWDRKEIDRHIARGENQQVHFDRKIPIHITYFTATVTEQGELVTRSDIYGHDRRLMAALNGAEPVFDDLSDAELVTSDIQAIPVLPGKKKKKTRIVINEDEPTVIVDKKKKRGDQPATKR